ncbi:MAG: hypothetical protein ABUJ92_10565 [Desulfobacterales bacterium]
MIVGHFRKPFFCKTKTGDEIWKKPFKTRRKVGANENTTWFDDHEKMEEIYTITDFKGGLIIGGSNYEYPIFVYDVTKSDINDDIGKALDLKKMYMET